MNRLTIATLNLERGEAVELLPQLTAQAGEIDLLLMQEGGNWHRDGHRARYRAEELLAAAGLGHRCCHRLPAGPHPGHRPRRASAHHQRHPKAPRPVQPSRSQRGSLAADRTFKRREPS